MNSVPSFKCSRFLGAIRERVLVVHKELQCDIPKRSCSMIKQQSDKTACEKWGKRKKQAHSYFKQLTLNANIYNNYDRIRNQSQCYRYYL